VGECAFAVRLAFLSLHQLASTLSYHSWPKAPMYTISRMRAGLLSWVLDDAVPLNRPEGGLPFCRSRLQPGAIA